MYCLAGSYWLVSAGVLGPAGQLASGHSRGGPGISFDGVPIPLSSMPSACQTLAFQNPREFASCVAGHGYRALISYQPASRYWAFQGIETAIYLVLAAILVTVAAIVVARRDA